MSKILKVAAFAIVAIVASVSFVGCPGVGPEGPAGPAGEFTGQLPPITDVNALFSDGGTVIQGFDSGYGSHGFQNDGRFAGFGLNTYRTGSVITFDGVASDGTKALRFKSGALAADDDGFNVNRVVTGLYTTGWYQITVSRRFLSAHPSAAAAELNIQPKNIYSATQPGTVATAITLPTVADSDFVNVTYYVNLQDGYSAIALGFYLTSGVAATESVELLIGGVAVTKIAAPPATAITVDQVDAPGGYVWDLTDTDDYIGGVVGRDYAQINPWGDDSTVTETGSGISVSLAGGANPWDSWRIAAPTLPAGTYNVTINFASHSGFLNLMIGSTPALSTLFVPAAGNVTINGVVVPATGSTAGRMWIGKLVEDPRNTDGVEDADDLVAITGGNADVANGTHAVVFNSITFDRQ